MDKEAFTTLILQGESTLYRVAKSILHHDQDVEDAVQEGILKAYKKVNTLKNIDYFQTWLVRIIINECYGILRKRKEYLTLEAAETLSDPEINTYSDLYNAISLLTPKIRVTIVLYYVEGYSTKEIKEILKIPHGTVKSRLAKGRKALKAYLEEGE
ncbi:MAG: sigma-70 family RNA polymerase sigma factor [Bacillota bacterium]|nr:sigma-70 family RNA polymerase sigma factor [Bacillota bacterium]